MLPAIGIKAVMVILAFGSLFGTVIWSIGNHTADVLFCGFCRESIDILSQDIVNVLTQSQGRVTNGVDSLVRIRDDPKYIENFERSDLLNLVSSAKTNIYQGSAITIILIFLAYMVFNFIGHKIFGGFYPALFAVIVSFLIIGIVGVVASSGQIGFYEGWIKLVSNWSVL